MNTIPAQTYYTVILPIILGALPVIYIALMLLWDKKWVPMQRRRGAAVASFGNIFARVVRFAFKEDPLKFLPKVDNKFTNKFLTLKAINWFLVILTFALLGLKNENAWLTALILILVVWIRSAPVMKQRNQILQRMYQVASSVFRYGRGAELNPWAYVKIKKWEALTVPGETHVSIPASWDASSIAGRDGFERHFNGTVTDNNSWIYQWESAKGIVVCQPINHLPTMANYPGSEKYEWSTIPLGVGSAGEVTVDLTKTPHMLVCGSTGSGKSVLQRNLIFHCIQHNDMWRFLGVDVKRVELTPFKRYKKTVLGIGANLEDGVEIVRYAKEIMNTRYQEMEDKGVNHFKDLIDPETGKPPYAVMLMIDEAFMFMSPEGAKTDEGKMRDQLHGEASTILGDIARLGRASGVHLVLATQRPDATVIKGELKANLDIRIAAGRLDSTPSMMVLDSGAATMLPGDIKGRGIVRFGGDQQQFQGYFAPQDWIETWLAEHPGVEPDLYPADGKSQTQDVKDELLKLEEGYDFDDGEIEVDGQIVSTDPNELNDLLEELDDEEMRVPSGLTPKKTTEAEIAASQALVELDIEPEEKPVVVAPEQTVSPNVVVSERPSLPTMPAASPLPKLPPLPGGMGVASPKLPPLPPLPPRK